jgi:hypothetical protein
LEPIIITIVRMVKTRSKTTTTNNNKNKKGGGKENM